MRTAWEQADEIARAIGDDRVANACWRIRPMRRRTRNLGGVTRRRGIRHTLAIKSDDQVAGSIARIEEWRGGKLAWRLQGEILCSNGDVTCQLSLPNMMDPDNPANGEDDHATAVERIDDDGVRNAEWIVLANLHQKLYYSGGANVEFVNGFGREYEDAYARAQYLQVRWLPGGERHAKAKVEEPVPTQQIVGTLYGIPQLCDAYKHEGALIPSILGVQPDADFRFGTW